MSGWQEEVGSLWDISEQWMHHCFEILTRFFFFFLVATLTANSKFLEIQQQGGSATLSDLEIVFKEELPSIEKGKREFKEKHMTKKKTNQSCGSMGPLESQCKDSSCVSCPAHLPQAVWVHCLCYQPTHYWWSPDSWHSPKWPKAVCDS